MPVDQVKTCHVKNVKWCVDLCRHHKLFLPHTDLHCSCWALHSWTQLACVRSTAQSPKNAIVMQSVHGPSPHAGQLPQQHAHNNSMFNCSCRVAQKYYQYWHCYSTTSTTSTTSATSATSTAIVVFVLCLRRWRRPAFFSGLWHSVFASSAHSLAASRLSMVCGVPHFNSC